MNLRKRLNACEEATGIWRTSVSWGLCETNEHISYSIDNLESNCYTIKSLHSAQTAYLVGVIFFAFGCIYAVKSMRYSSFYTKVNWRMIFAWLIMFGLTVVLTAIPGLLGLIGFDRIPILLWGFPASIFVVLVLGHEELRKFLITKSKWIKAMTDF